MRRVPVHHVIDRVQNARINQPRMRDVSEMFVGLSEFVFRFERRNQHDGSTDRFVHIRCCTSFLFGTLSFSRRPVLLKLFSESVAQDSRFDRPSSSVHLSPLFEFSATNAIDRSLPFAFVYALAGLLASCAQSERDVLPYVVEDALT